MTVPVLAWLTSNRFKWLSDLVRRRRPQRFNGFDLDDWCCFHRRLFIHCAIDRADAIPAVDTALHDAIHISPQPVESGAAPEKLVVEGPTEEIRCLAAIRCGLVAHLSMEAPLLAALDDVFERVRRVAAISLVEVGTVSALAAVAAGTRHGHAVRGQAASLLGQRGVAAESAIPALLALLADREINWRSHWTAVDALAAIGDAGKEALRAALPTIRGEHLRGYVEGLVAGSATSGPG